MSTVPAIAWIGRRAETEAYLRVAAERYRLLRTHTLSEEVLRRVLGGRGRRQQL